MWTAQQGHESTVQALIDAGATKDIQSKVSLLSG